MDGKIAFILAMMLVTYPVRLLPLAALSARRLPDPVVRWLSYVPPAVFSAMVVPSVFLRNGAVDLGVGNPYLLAAAATLAVALITRNLSKSVVMGILVAFLGEALVGT